MKGIRGVISIVSYLSRRRQRPNLHTYSSTIILSSNWYLTFLVMSSTALVDFTPDGIDMVYAISQQDLNKALAEYLSELKASVSWGFDVVQGQLHPPANPTNPNISFAGTLGEPVETVAGAPAVYTLDFSQAAADSNSVTFNVTFRGGATFTNHMTGHTSTQVGASWVFPFKGTLTKSTMTTAQQQQKLPAWLQKQLAILTGQYGNVFDVTQWVLDLETLTPSGTGGSMVPGGMSQSDWLLLLNGMNSFMPSHASTIFTTPPAAGYVVTQNSATPTLPLPPYTPTAVDLVMLPNTTTPAASTLIFALMVQGAPLPASPASAFTNVSLITDPTTTPSIALINTARTTTFVQNDFASASTGISTAIRQYVETVSTGSGITWQLVADPSPTAAPVSTTLLTPGEPVIPTGVNTLVASFAMEAKTSTAAANPPGEASYSGAATSTSTAVVGYTPSTTPGVGYGAVTLSGCLATTFSLSSTPAAGSTDPPVRWTSPAFAWNWSAAYSIEPATPPQKFGPSAGVQFALQSTGVVIPTQAVAQGAGAGGWAEVAADMQTYLSGLLAPAVQTLPNTLPQSFQSLAGLGGFVFPVASGNFNFQNAAVNNEFALYASIGYKAPS